MSESDILDPPLLLPIPVGGDEAWKREYVAFLQLLPELLTNLRDKYVAVHDGAVVAVADSFKDAALQAYERCGYVPLHVGKVSDRPQPPARIPSSRILRSGNEE